MKQWIPIPLYKMTRIGFHSFWKHKRYIRKCVSMHIRMDVSSNCDNNIIEVTH